MGAGFQLKHQFFLFKKSWWGRKKGKTGTVSAAAAEAAIVWAKKKRGGKEKTQKGARRTSVCRGEGSRDLWFRGDQLQRNLTGSAAAREKRCYPARLRAQLAGGRCPIGGTGWGTGRGTARGWRSGTGRRWALAEGGDWLRPGIVATRNTQAWPETS